jgi:cyclopropane fatty-acyl-phospholipid synthase-like methyltransferase
VGGAVLDPLDREQQQGELAAKSPSLELRIGGDSLQLDHRNLAAATVNLYEIDLEVLFSRNPFAGSFAGQFGSIRPNRTLDVALAADAGSTRVPLPEELVRKNLLVEVTAGGITRSQPFFSTGMAVRVVEPYGQVAVTRVADGSPVAKAYVKVYARSDDGHVAFHKDGFTDLRGRFDKIASIEMLEAVGDRYVDGYFAKIDELLHPQGLLGLQAILCPDNQYPILRDGVDFIQKHIFPGSLLMCNARIAQALHACGDLNLIDCEDMAPHYALTLQRWRETFEEKLEAVRALGFDEIFLRKWRYYLAYCEAAFGTRHITVAQFVMSRPDNLAIPSAIYSI